MIILKAYQITFHTIIIQTLSPTIAGRDRAENGKSFLIALADSNYETRELANKAREDMQNKAVEYLCQIPPEKFKAKVLHQQNQDVKEEERLAEQKASAPALPQGGFTLLCGKCMTYVCSCTDIGQYRSNYIVLDEVFSSERARFERHSSGGQPSEDLKKVGKVYCRGSNCTKDWGIVGEICEQKVPVIKLKSFVVRNDSLRPGAIGYQERYKQWKLKPFSVKQLTEEDLLTLPRLDIPDFA